MVRERVLEAKAQGATKSTSSAGCITSGSLTGTFDIVASSTKPGRRFTSRPGRAVEISLVRPPTKEALRLDPEADDRRRASQPSPAAEPRSFDESVRSQICEHKADSQSWLDIHRTAHQLGLRSNATMLYGHVEQAKHRIDHLMRLRDLQDEPVASRRSSRWPFHPENTGMAYIPKPTGHMDLRNGRPRPPDAR